MSKRNTTARLSLSTKRPKLDIIVNSQTNREFNEHNSTNNVKRETKAKAGVPNGNQDDLWGDDLDLVAVEECMFKASQLTQQVPDQNVSALPSFTEFRPPQMCSTQNINIKSTMRKRDDISEVFSTPFSFNMAPSSSTNFNKPPGLNTSKHSNACIGEKNAPVFCRPPVSSNSMRFNKNNMKTYSNGHLQNGAEELKARLPNVNVNQHIQKELEYLKSENDRLKTENGKAMDRFLTKEGEVTILRSQLASSKALAESLRMERLQMNEKSRIEQEKQLALANKQINDLMAQLKFKDLEVTNAHDRCRLLESKRIRLTEPQSQRLSDVTQFPIANHLKSPTINRPTRIEKKSTSSISIQTTSNSVLNVNEDDIKELPLLDAFPKDLYEECQYENDKIEMKIKYSGDKHNDQDCLRTRSFLSDIYHLSKLSKNQLKNPNLQKHLNKIMAITKELAFKVSSSLKEPTEQLQKRLCKKISADETEIYQNIYQARPWRNEIFVELRRCLAITAVLITHCPYLQSFLNDESYDKLINYDLDTWFREHKDCLTHHTENKSIISSLLDILDNLPETNLCSIHEPLLISIAEFMISCFKTSTTQRDLLQNMLKTIVFLKSPPKVIQRIADLLEFLSVEGTYLEILCVNSRDKLALDFEKGVYVFTIDSCFLQVYAITLETCIAKTYVKQGEYSTLHVLTRRIINFVHNSMSNDVAWTYMQTRCHCLPSIMTSIVVLLHYCIEQYNSRSSILGYKSGFVTSLGQVLQSGVLTLHQLLMRDSEQTNVSLQLGHFGGRFLEIVNFACDNKLRLFADTLDQEFFEQVLKDLLFYHPMPEEDLRRSEVLETTFDDVINFDL